MPRIPVGCAWKMPLPPFDRSWTGEAPLVPMTFACAVPRLPVVDAGPPEPDVWILRSARIR